jgi:hypothetical protein
MRSIFFKNRDLKGGVLKGPFVILNPINLFEGFNK